MQSVPANEEGDELAPEKYVCDEEDSVDDADEEDGDDSDSDGDSENNDDALVRKALKLLGR